MLRLCKYQSALIGQGLLDEKHTIRYTGDKPDRSLAGTDDLRCDVAVHTQAPMADSAAGNRVAPKATHLLNVRGDETLLCSACAALVQDEMRQQQHQSTSQAGAGVGAPPMVADMFCMTVDRARVLDEAHNAPSADDQNDIMHEFFQQLANLSEEQLGRLNNDLESSQPKVWQVEVVGCSCCGFSVLHLLQPVAAYVASADPKQAALLRAQAARVWKAGDVLTPIVGASGMTIVTKRLTRNTAQRILAAKLWESMGKGSSSGSAAQAANVVAAGRK